MKCAVKDLRHGWCGNEHLFDEENADPNSKIPVVLWDVNGNPTRFKKPVNCSKLVDTAIGFVNSKYINICDGIGGTDVDNLIIDNTCEPTTEGMPIDLLVIDLSRGETAENAIDIDTL